jgi:DNA-directed RNA polymerase, mitochondrial
MHNSVQTVLDTLALEDGAKRYDKDFNYKRSHQMITSAEWPLFRKAFPVVSEAVSKAEALKMSGMKRQFWQDVLAEVGSDNVAYIGLQSVFYHAIERNPETEAATAIGRLVYAQLKQKPEYKDEVVLGLQVLECVMEADLFQSIEPEGQSYRNIEFTDEAVKQMHDLQEWQRYMHPIYRPMVAKPRSVAEGSYLDERLASTVQMVKTMNKEQKAMIAGAVKAGAKFVEACDTIQSVPLTINEWILPVIEKAYHCGLAIGSVPTSRLPEGKTPDDRRLRSQLKSQQAGFLTDLNEAKHYTQYEEVFLPATMDFRGRVYAKPHLNHQRADYVKAMWLFAEGKPLTYRGLDELKIHIANTGDFQKMSKAPFADRIKWVDDNFPRIYETIQDPWSDLWWTEADSPFCFMAACHAYCEWFENPETYVCHLPIAIDGSCSGLQHYSAMLRDAQGAKSVNLVPTEQPEDVYKEVANIVNELVIADRDDPLAQEWLKHRIDRKVTKRATMTLCYGSKQYGWREQLIEDFMNQYKKEIAVGKREVHPFTEPGKAAGYMAKKLDKALRMTVKAAVEGMDWLQETASLLAKDNKPITWTTPVGFPVVNGYYEPILKRIDIRVRGRRFQNQLLLGYTDKLKATKQRSTIAPNFVHSFDACHLMMVALAAKKEGINSFLLIHDSFGCLPSDMERFSEIVREQFVNLYQNHDPFMAVHHTAHVALSEKTREKLTLPPAKGSLNIEDVINSKYAFA